jgi:hypothetical protein
MATTAAAFAQHTGRALPTSSEIDANLAECLKAPVKKALRILSSRLFLLVIPSRLPAARRSGLVKTNLDVI